VLLRSAKMENGENGSPTQAVRVGSPTAARRTKRRQLPPGAAGGEEDMPVLSAEARAEMELAARQAVASIKNGDHALYAAARLPVLPAKGATPAASRPQKRAKSLH